ncbi:MAG: hypothetical protein LJE56_01440 [Acidiferrobacterales bacterium]|jgi:uncharacterized protein|nr:hypothetical protein [Acidiferrobacterales bacterium]
MGYLLRLVILLILGWLAYRLVRRLVADESPRPSGKQARIEIVPCAKCGVHIPREEALMHNGKAYCSAAHMEEDTK